MHLNASADPTQVPVFPKRQLIDWAGWQVFKNASDLHQVAGFEGIAWEAPILSGCVRAYGGAFWVKLRLPPKGLPEIRCNCALGRQGNLCSHAVALYLHQQSPHLKDASKPAVGSSEAPFTTAAQQEPIVVKNPLLAQAPLFDSPSSSNILDKLIVEGSLEYLSIKPADVGKIPIQRLKSLLSEDGFSYQPSLAAWVLRGRHAILTFIAKRWKALHNRHTVEVGKHFQPYVDKLQFTTLNARLQGKNREDLHLHLALENEGWNREEVDEAVRKGQLYLEKAEKILILESAALENLSHLQQLLTGDKNRTTTVAYNKKLDLADLPFVMECCNVSNISLQTELENKLAGAAREGAFNQPPLSKELLKKLRGYQKIGVTWLYYLYSQQLGGILADEMGLGKTVQAIALLESVLSSQKGITQCLVVCPASLVENWKRELTTFLPSASVAICHGRNSSLSKLASGSQAAAIIITSYTTLSLHEERFREMEFGVALADEGQWIKNKSTKAAKAIKSLKAYSRFILTGTPIENSLTDLYSLFEYILPGYLKPLPKNATQEDQAWFKTVIKKQAAPYILRRTKNQVAPELPAKMVQTLYCPMTDQQKALYQTVKSLAQENIQHATAASKKSNVLSVLKELLRLRQICIDPRLIDPNLPESSSAKMLAFQDLLPEMIAGGHRVLVFSQFIEVLRLLQKTCQKEGWPHLYLDGSTPDRLALCDQFNNTPEIPLFLISLKAGGVGLNLTGADTVLIYDPWWNPAVEAQAIDRAHRIGQQQTVTSIKFITTESVEEKIVSLQNKKQMDLDQLWEANEAFLEGIHLETLQDLLA